MNNPPRKLEWLVWGGLILVVAVIGAAFVRSKLAVPELPLPVIGQIPDFRLTNQNDETISMADLRGKVWVADIIFTRCPGPCRTITGQFQAMQASLPADPSFRLVTLTSDPEYDTPKVMKKFAAEFHADSNRCWFLTGNKPEIRSLAVNDFKFVVVEKPPGDRTVPDDLFIHSTWFALVDRQGRVHGWIDRAGQEHAIFESDDPEAQARLQSAIKQLLRQPVS
jgi:protein SCO1/2